MDSKQRRERREQLLSELPARHRAFVEALLADPERNAAKAYRAAGYTSKDPSVHGARLIRTDRVGEIIRLVDSETLDKIEVTNERILQEAADIAFGTAADVASWGPGHLDLKDSKTLSRRGLAALASVSVTTRPDGTTKQSFKMHNKLEALQLLEKLVNAGHEGDREQATDVVIQFSLSDTDDKSEDPR